MTAFSIRRLLKYLTTPKPFFTWIEKDRTWKVLFQSNKFLPVVWSSGHSVLILTSTYDSPFLTNHTTPVISCKNILSKRFVGGRYLKMKKYRISTNMWRISWFRWNLFFRILKLPFCLMVSGKLLSNIYLPSMFQINCSLIPISLGKILPDENVSISCNTEVWILDASRVYNFTSVTHQIT